MWGLWDGRDLIDLYRRREDAETDLGVLLAQAREDLAPRPVESPQAVGLSIIQMHVLDRPRFAVEAAAARIRADIDPTALGDGGDPRSDEEAATGLLAALGLPDPDAPPRRSRAGERRDRG